MTLDDIAKEANVSPSTVSRVISNNPNISAATRKKVLKIMERMNYQPNIVARSLANNSTKTLGVVLASRTEKALRKALQYPSCVDILGGLSLIAYKNGYNILLSSLNKMDDDKRRIRELAKGGITDGIIYLYPRVNDPIIEELRSFNSPFVVIGKPINENEVNWVDNDNFALSYKMTELFINRGHKKIAFLGAATSFAITVDRVDGYKKALLDHSIPIDENLIIKGRFVTDNGYELMKEIFDHGIVPTGVIAQDDLIAFGAIKQIKERGLSVPNDIAVAGFNNVPTAEFYTPSLTSVEMNAFDIGAKACEMLLSCIKSSYNGFARTIVPAELKIRSSV
ncbi:MAG TPA: LacI family DNA-binding transcriptional regulator [Caproicibacter sp.]|nr:LacI family DNA-binding transcriptional regulator [Caproicibacter sp.]